jgi:hypothetical protein
VQLIIDTAKMFKYAEKNTPHTCVTTLHRRHFEQALDQLKNESIVLEESLTNKIEKKINQWGAPLSFIINIGVLTNMSYSLLTGDSLFTSTSLKSHRAK